MKRRDLFKNSLAASALAGLAAVAPRARRARAAPGPAPAAPPAEFPKAPGLTRSVAEFIVGTKYEDLPADVIELGKKSILDGFGLALAGSVSAMGPLVQKYVQSFGAAPSRAS
ncbi:MAG TPA: hypothetical protein VHW23_03895, partial [Kofleriaceae bacterium]|nr:hypothetical protein [Kofleriaceae bacterium]